MIPPADNNDTDRNYITIRVRRAPLYVWLARFVWVIMLALLLEHTLDSWREHEPQAAIMAGGLCLALLITGLIIEVVRHIEAQPDPYRSALEQLYNAKSSANDEEPGSS